MDSEMQPIEVHFFYDYKTAQSKTLKIKKQVDMN